MALVDSNRDGFLDFVAGQNEVNAITQILNKGDGLFDRPPRSPAGEVVSRISIGDVDSDGSLDFIASLLSKPELLMLFGDDEGSFGEKEKDKIARERC